MSTVGSGVYSTTYYYYTDMCLLADACNIGQETANMRSGYSDMTRLQFERGNPDALSIGYREFRTNVA